MSAMSLSPHDVAIVHVPFIEREGGRKRPVVILSSQAANKATGVAVVAMITRGDAPARHGDMTISRYEEAGLHKPCKIRMKIYTVETAQLTPVGRLQTADSTALTSGLRALLAL
jgi:mRNA interferase MazF